MKPCAYYNEIDPFARTWLQNAIDAGVIAPGVIDERSIVDVRPGDLKGITQCHWFAGIGTWSVAARAAGIPDRLWNCRPSATQLTQKRRGNL